MDSEEHVDLIEMQSEINANFNEDTTSELKSVVDPSEHPQLLSQDDIQRQIQENKKRKKKRKRTKDKPVNIELASSSQEIIV
jgi:hypothetical protein